MGPYLIGHFFLLPFPLLALGTALGPSGAGVVGGGAGSKWWVFVVNHCSHTDDM